MSIRRPDVTDEDIGMRAFQLRKAKAVERAVERLRHSLANSWSSLTSHEIEELEWVLGELWAYVARVEWDDLHFGRLDLDETRQIIALSRDIRKHTRDAVAVLKEIDALVAAKG